MKITVLFIYLLFISHSLYSQWIPLVVSPIDDIEVLEESPDIQPKHIIHKIVDTKASYPGGDSAMTRFILSEFMFNPEMVQNNISGAFLSITIPLHVMKDSSLRSKGYDRTNPLKKEIHRIIQLMPKWNPAKINDTLVNSLYLLKFKKPLIMPWGYYNSYTGKKNLTDSTYYYSNPDIHPKEYDSLIPYSTLLTNSLECPLEYLENKEAIIYSFSMIVDTNGRASQFELTGRAYSESLDAAALKNLSNLPRYQPAYVRNKKVNSLKHIVFCACKFDFDETIMEERPDQVFYASGLNELRRYIGSNFIKPNNLPDNLSGKLYFEFEINEQNEAVNIKLLKGLYPSLDSEIIRLMKATKGWNNGTVNNGVKGPYILNIPYPFPF